MTEGLFVLVFVRDGVITVFFVTGHPFSHKHISSLSRLLQHIVSDFSKSAILWLQIPPRPESLSASCVS